MASVFMASSAVSMGIAKPMPAALARIAVLMPMTCNARSRAGSDPRTEGASDYG